MRVRIPHPDSGHKISYEIHPALTDLDDFHNIIGDILFDAVEDYEQLKRAAYEHYRHAGHTHEDSDKWATVIAEGILPRGATTETGVPW